MTVNEYFEALKGKRVCIIGLGISNRPLVKMLLERGIPVECRDRTPREKLLPEVLELELRRTWYSALRASMRSAPS